RFMVFDTEADGGLRMSSEAVTRAGVLARLAADDDFADEQERCAFYRSLVPWELSEVELADVNGGRCATETVALAAD
ncbi:MAG: hypothetical protein O7G30_15695, partial [Proteobacteria bacterium]|nr:hypothetical protein [Pseudomonadota bacterium]